MSQELIVGLALLAVLVLGTTFWRLWQDQNAARLPGGSLEPVVPPEGLYLQPRARRFGDSVEDFTRRELREELEAEAALGQAVPDWTVVLQDDFVLKVEVEGLERSLVAPLGRLYANCEEHPAQADDLRREFVEDMVQRLLRQDLP